MVTHVTIDLTTVIRVGKTPCLVRMHSGDAHEIVNAAAALGVSKACFIRTVLVKAAREVNKDGQPKGKKA